MTRQQKLDVIRQKCIEANPEIVELKFGSLFLGRASSRDSFDSVFYFENWKEKNKTIRCLGPLGNQYVWDIEYIKIIGRPIRLADVLFAFTKHKTDSLACFVATDLILIRKSKIYWKLLKDDLTLQSDGCIDFVYKLIK